MRRREFLRSATAAGLGSWAGLQLSGRLAEAMHASRFALPDANFPADDYLAPNWLRYAQTVYFDGYSPPVYPHIRDFDAGRLVETVEELGGDSLRFQPIGYWAYYPSKAFRVFPELAGRDLITEVAQESRRKGIHCYCYTGYGHPHMEVGWVDKHPEYADWVLRNPEGKPYGEEFWHIGWANRQRLCTTGDAYRAGIRQVVRELCQYDIEGVYFDAPSVFVYSGICFCESCRRNFRKFSGMDLDRLDYMATNNLPYPLDDFLPNALPKEGDMGVLIAWYAWADQLVREDLLDFRKIIHGSGKFMLCHNAGTWLGTSLPLQYRIPDGFMVEDSAEVDDRLMTGLMGASMARPYKKQAQMYLGGYNVATMEDPPHEVPSVTHNTNLEDGDEIRMEGFANLACGNVPLYATANRLYTKVGSGSSEPAREVFSLMKRVEAIHRDSEPVPYVTIVPTWESLQLWRENRKSWNWPMMCKGMGLILLDERISFDVNPSTEMSDEWLEKQKVIALCGASGISDDGAKRLSDWVKRGGGLLATYDSGLYDEKGRLRQDGGALREALGVKMKGEPLPSMSECYYRVKEQHAALGAYGQGAIVEGDGRLVSVDVLAGAKLIAECWNNGTDEVRGPAVVVNNYGRGRTVYISGSLEANYLYDRVSSSRTILRTVVEYLSGGALQPFRLKAPHGIYGVLRRSVNGDPVLWLLANVGFKDSAAGRMRQEYVPVDNIEVSLQIPQGRQMKDLRLLRSGQVLSHRLEDGYAVATIPSLHIAEMVHLSLV